MVARPDATSRLPSQLLVDTSDRARCGVRITLQNLQPRARRVTPEPVDCAGAPTDDVAIRSLEYVVVDVETTGGSWGRGHRVTEVCAVRLRGDGTWLDEFRTLINPERSIPYGVAQLTNISWDMVQQAPRFGEVAAELARALSGAVFVAHNVQFDWHFIGAELGRIGVPLSGRTLCTVQLARKVVPELRGKSLDDLAWFFDIHNEARHRAYGDARATAELFRKLIARLDELEVTRWSELDELLRRRAQRRKRRAHPHSMWQPVP